jgi:hypothetical protein
MKYITGFFAFWWDFIVGDAWEVAAGVLALIVLVFALVQGTRADWAVQYAGLLLPLGVVVLLSLSLWALARKR